MMQNSPNNKRKTKMNEMKHFNQLVNPLTHFSLKTKSFSTKLLVERISISKSRNG